MTHYIAHRINTIQELKALPTEFGVELDLRDSGDDLILQHDPFSAGELFSDYLSYYHHGTLILNVKSERIEHRIKTLLDTFGIEDYFFLDSSFPMIHLLSKEGEQRVAVRYSEYEGLDTIRNMANRIEWVWVDCFSKLPITRDSYEELKALGLKLCLVSPELQGREDDIESYKSSLQEMGITFDAICTKHRNIDRWRS